MCKRFKQVDVFTSVKFKGNPVAVFFDADDLSSAEMQAIANWTNLSESTFVVKPTDPSADYGLRIFTPQKELPFAGHPTIGSCHAVIEQGIVNPRGDGKVVQECKAGLVELKYSESTKKIKFKLPYYKHTDVDLQSDLTSNVQRGLGVAHGQLKCIKKVDDGPVWITAELMTGEAVQSLEVDWNILRKVLPSNSEGFSVFGKLQSGEYEARNFVPSLSVEDPVCGSGAGADGSLLAACYGFEGAFTIRQGRCLGRDGIISVEVEKARNAGNDYTISVGGNAVTCMDGKY